MIEPALSDKLDAAWGDPETWVANGLQWIHLDEIQALINRRVSGDPSISPLAWFARHVQAAGALPVRRALVVGCGTGEIERELHAHGWASEIVAFDLSPKALARARRAAVGMDSITYVLASMDELPVGEPPFEPGSFDAVIGVASIHHCGQLETLYARLARLLTPDGWFFLREYVGPDRFQYSSAHMQQVATLAELLPESLVTTRSGQVKRGFRAPTVAEVVAVDPSEAVCSSRILPLLAEHFDIVAQRPYGGAVLHVLLADIAQNFLPAEAKPWLTALIEAEEELDRLGLLEQHFSCAIARPRRAASGSPSPAR